MIRVTIGDSERELADVKPQWVNEQINRRRAEGVPVCVRVMIRTDSLNLALATPCCPGLGGGGGRPPSSEETKILALWEKQHLNVEGFTGGNLIAFLKQLS